MRRKLKVYQTSQGFYDLAVAAPSMKAALQAWGAGSNLFQQGFARVAADAKVVAAALGKPGKVLRRPVGSTTPFGEDARLPTIASLDAALPSQAKLRPRPATPKVSSPKPTKSDEKTKRLAAALYAKEQAKREQQRRAGEKAAAVASERRRAVVQKAQAALDEATRDHEDQIKAIEDNRTSVDRREIAENERWAKVRARLKAALQRARD